MEETRININDYEPSGAGALGESYISKNNPIDSRQLGFIPEERIIGRVCLVLFSRDPQAPFWKGYRSDRLLLPK